MNVSKRQRRKMMWAYVFVLPQLVFFILFTIYPIIMSYIYSFYEWSGIGPLNNYVRWDNFARILHDQQFWHAFRTSLIYMVCKTGILMPLTLLLALLLNRPTFGGKTLYRTIFFLPVVTTTAVVGILMKFIFGNENALVNTVLMETGILHSPIPWLGQPATAMMVLIGVGSWKFFGMMMVYWLAGLQSLPADIYEAAKVDGAGGWASFKYMTVPLLVPYAVVILLLTVVNSMNVFDLVKTLTGGGPFHATETVDLYIYQYAFDTTGFPQMGYASAAGILFGITIFLLTVALGAFSRIVKKRESAGESVRSAAEGA